MRQDRCKGKPINFPSLFQQWSHEGSPFLIHTYTHTHSHTHIHTCMQTCLHMCKHACVHAHTHTHTRMHTHTYAHTHTHTCMYTHTHTCMYTHTHTCTHTHTHSLKCVCSVHTHTHTHTHLTIPTVHASLSLYCGCRAHILCTLFGQRVWNTKEVVVVVEDLHRHLHSVTGLTDLILRGKHSHL